MAKIISFKEWLRHKDQLNEEKQKNRLKIHHEQPSDNPDEIQANPPKLTPHNQSVKTLKMMKATSEQKKLIHNTTLKKLREALQDYVDQVVPTKPSRNPTNTVVSKQDEQR